MKILLCLLLFMLMANEKAQAERKSYLDYIVMNNSDTIYGKVLTGGSYVSNRIWVRVKPQHGPKQRYRMEEVKAFRSGGQDYLRKEFIHIRWPMKTYLRVEVAGEISMLYMRCPTAKLNYDLFAMLPNGEVFILNAHNFYTKLLPILQSSPRFLEQAGDGEVYYPRLNRHYYKDMARMFHWYNGTKPY